ncbi:hypothetical protein NVIRPANT_00301 [Pantoea sp. Nvir]|nr:hypothetical protein [Pantoea sp. Nvir]CAJ0991518.1 hypothetical protein NVIRPANT_00301 [Pantoea sp. Nvir]
MYFSYLLHSTHDGKKLYYDYTAWIKNTLLLAKTVKKSNLVRQLNRLIAFIIDYVGQAIRGILRL